MPDGPRDEAYTKHESVWPLEAMLVPLNHRFAFYSGWDAALKHLGVRLVEQAPSGLETDRG